MPGVNHGTATEQRRTRAESKEFTRQALLKAGLLELIEHGLDTPSLDAICARAGFTRGAFYVHFKDRDDFLVAITDWTLTGIVDVLVGVDGESDLESAVGRFTALLSTRDWPVVGTIAIATHRVFESIARSEKLKQRFTEIFNDAATRVGNLVKRAQESGQVRRDLDPRQAAVLLLALGVGAKSLEDTGVHVGSAALRSGILGLLKP
jgi:TetR/AcrR family transcriptional regulator, transcriptional repressor for nem operon